MAVTTVNNSLKTRDPERLPISTYLTQNAIKDRIGKMISGKDGDRFITAIVSAVSNNPKLAECDNSTILSAALIGESLKLSPSPQLGQYYLVPYNDNKNHRKVATFQIGYKGYIQLAIRSGYYKKLNVIAIKTGELKKYDPLNEEIDVKLIEDDEIREKTETIGYYAMFEYLNGFRKTMYWSKEKMQAHADKYSKAYSLEKDKLLKDGKIPEKDLWKYSSYWYDDFDGMAYKTMLRQLISKWGIMSIEMQTAFEKDMSIINEGGETEYIDSKTVDDAIDITPEQPTLIPEKTEATGFEPDEPENNDDPFLQQN